MGPNSVNVARYASLIGTKSPTKWDAQLAESNFQTHPSAPLPLFCSHQRLMSAYGGYPSLKAQGFPHPSGNFITLSTVWQYLVHFPAHLDTKTHAGTRY
ncbi:DUF6783 domain-containing protein [Enterocloster hominis (ex Hitch et al. 2024)]|uniref:DUF6783 domain-containing protein n=1 Tax=Enterocloster hominis (ex Hitch et al. 2024) TaxID=1917870 RepID=UPI002E366D39|nr:DUF6783 domain-containing protein [Lachnoclostridium pacaense]